MRGKLSVKVIFIFLIAFSLRVWFIENYTAPLVGDEVGYNSLAVSLLEGKGYVNSQGIPTAHRSPGYPLFLYIIFYFFGRDYFIVRIIQAIIDSILCILIYYLGRKLFDNKVGFLAAILASIHLGFIAQPAKILTEGLATFLLFIAIIFFLKSKQNCHRKTYYSLTGIFIGLCCLVRPSFIIIFPLFGSMIIYDLLKKTFSFKTVIKILLIYLMSFMVIILPWAIRNYKVFHAFVPLTTTQGRTLYESYHPVNGKIYGIVPTDEVTKKAESFSSEIEKNDFLTKETISLIKNDPFVFFKLIGLKMAYFLSPFDWELIQNKAIYNYLYVFYFPFFLIGFFLFFYRFNELSQLYLPIIGVFITVLVYLGIPRFRLTIEPYMIILSSSAIIYIYKKSKYKFLFILFLIGYLIGNILLFLNSSVIKQICKTLLESGGLW